jgi:hypothetical protein
VNGTCATLPTPGDCATYGAECGPIVNACGDTVSCGSCATGGQCQDRQCVPCQPVSCFGVYCGDVTNACGEVKHCGDCQSGATCYDGSCCSPKTCGDLRAGACGGADGCGGDVTCAACPAGTSCHYTTGECSECVPVSPCAGGTCGERQDNCGNMVDCGECEQCVPQNPCTAACGLQPDGCGGVVNCNGAQCGSGPPLH